MFAFWNIKGPIRPIPSMWRRPAAAIALPAAAVLQRQPTRQTWSLAPITSPPTPQVRAPALRVECCRRPTPTLPRIRWSRPWAAIARRRRWLRAHGLCRWSHSGRQGRRHHRPPLISHWPMVEIRRSCKAKPYPTRSRRRWFRELHNR